MFLWHLKEFGPFDIDVKYYFEIKIISFQQSHTFMHQQEDIRKQKPEMDQQ